MDKKTEIVNKILKAEIRKRKGKFSPGEYTSLIKRLDKSFGLNLFPGKK
jgi:hypothetical protein